MSQDQLTDPQISDFMAPLDQPMRRDAPTRNALSLIAVVALLGAFDIGTFFWVRIASISVIAVGAIMLARASRKPRTHLTHYLLFLVAFPAVAVTAGALRASVHPADVRMFLAAHREAVLPVAFTFLAATGMFAVGNTVLWYGALVARWVASYLGALLLVLSVVTVLGAAAWGNVADTSSLSMTFVGVALSAQSLWLGCVVRHVRKGFLVG